MLKDKLSGFFQPDNKLDGFLAKEEVKFDGFSIDENDKFIVHENYQHQLVPEYPEFLDPYMNYEPCLTYELFKDSDEIKAINDYTEERYQHAIRFEKYVWRDPDNMKYRWMISRIGEMAVQEVTGMEALNINPIVARFADQEVYREIDCGIRTFSYNARFSHLPLIHNQVKEPMVIVSIKHQPDSYLCYVIGYATLDTLKDPDNLTTSNISNNYILKAKKSFYRFEKLISLNTPDNLTVQDKIKRQEEFNHIKSDFFNVQKIRKAIVEQYQRRIEDEQPRPNHHPQSNSNTEGQTATA